MINDATLNDLERLAEQNSETMQEILAALVEIGATLREISETQKAQAYKVENSVAEFAKRAANQKKDL